jgi:hypothetical protein
MRELMKRLEALEAKAPRPDGIAQIVIQMVEADEGRALPWNPNYASNRDGRELWRLEDESPEQFEERAKATFPGSPRHVERIIIERRSTAAA